MAKRFFDGTTRGLRICFAGFVLTAVGVAAGFLGFQVGQRSLSVAGFAVTLVGVVVGGIGIATGWIEVIRRK